jgi:hypothetical protein
MRDTPILSTDGWKTAVWMTSFNSYLKNTARTLLLTALLALLRLIAPVYPESRTPAHIFVTYFLHSKWALNEVGNKKKGGMK